MRALQLPAGVRLLYVLLLLLPDVDVQGEVSSPRTCQSFSSCTREAHYRDGEAYLCEEHARKAVKTIRDAYHYSPLPIGHPAMVVMAKRLKSLEDQLEVEGEASQEGGRLLQDGESLPVVMQHEREACHDNSPGARPIPVLQGLQLPYL